MDTDLLKKILEIPSVSREEHLMARWLVQYIMEKYPNTAVAVDAALNVYVSKGSEATAPCVAAHIDTVHAPQKVTIQEDGDRLIGVTPRGRAGIGADDKTGIFVCLNLLERFNNIKAVFFASEEIGCAGAKVASAQFFKDVGYLVEYDCPSRNMLSHTCSGVRLFANRGEFIQTAFPVLRQHGTLLWQSHPYTDVMAIRKRFPISCLNLSSGYYNWHTRDEFASKSDVELAIEQGEALLKALGNLRYHCALDIKREQDAPLIPIRTLTVPEPRPA